MTDGGGSHSCRPSPVVGECRFDSRRRHHPSPWRMMSAEALAKADPFLQPLFSDLVCKVVDTLYDSVKPVVDGHGRT